MRKHGYILSGSTTDETMLAEIRRDYISAGATHGKPEGRRMRILTIEAHEPDFNNEPWFKTRLQGTVAAPSWIPSGVDGETVR
jgi:hypothetical protein